MQWRLIVDVVRLLGFRHNNLRAEQAISDAVTLALPRHLVVNDVSIDGAAIPNLPDLKEFGILKLPHGFGDRVDVPSHQCRQRLLRDHHGVVATDPRDQQMQ
jgi:hypothetical protein